MKENFQPIAILGAGSWGTALALYLARRNQAVRLWAYTSDQAELLTSERCNNRYLPGHTFPDCLSVTSDLAAAIKEDCDILIAVPSSGFRDLLISLKPLLKKKSRIAWVTKGLDPSTGSLLHTVALDVLGNQYSYAILSGPSFARDVAQGLPTAIVAASDDAQFANDLMLRFNSEIFRVYVSNDIIGTEVGGVVKNVLAIAVGITDGMQLGANARCALITRGLAEIIRLGLALGGQYETFTGLTGLGDLILTCTDNQSRNRRFGLAIGSGKSVAEAEKEIGQVIEGKNNAERLALLAQKLSVDMPITNTVLKVLQNKISLREALHSLLSRAPKAEND
ncbi:MAG: NAD(P)-dependent glycerol-3-phosphate dehydrogenase [Gammaproteobacteria bacterium]|nr:NAD(P)-dependent glycerol-3-phosphate dehydrogenase [Gammaproteobacteria bacterium]